MGRHVALLAALMVTMAGLPLAGAGHLEELGCGGLSPFANECTDTDGEDYGGHWVAETATLGYIGRINISLLQWIPWFQITVRETVTCDYLPLHIEDVVEPVCTGPFRSPSWWPGLIPGLPVTLRCRAYPHGGIPAEVPPSGPWGCTADL